ncbi:MAG: hypothetical protein M3Y64_11480 [Gemmatimonadota bacterium]|nr:hypothetical protein [Gemmatimonadota bacterium]
MTASQRPTRRLYLLSALFVIIGTAHFFRPLSFERIVPGWVPNASLAVMLSGVAEIAGGLGLLIPATRKIAGWCLIALLIAVFPANIKMLQLARDAHDGPLRIALLWLRLPFQPLLVWWIWQAALRKH